MARAVGHREPELLREMAVSPRGIGLRPRGALTGLCVWTEFH